jgi:hypothetical protein
MLTNEQKVRFASLRVEIIDIHILTCLYVKKLNRLGYLFKNQTRYYLYEEFIALRYMENGIILHLTNLDDDSSNFSFREIRKEFNKSIKQKEILHDLNNKFGSYRAKVNKMKIKHRNKRIAHLNYTEELDFDIFLNFDSYLKPLIIEANELGDLIWGEKIQWKLKLGSHEKVLDFREMFEHLKVDFGSQKEF